MIEIKNKKKQFHISMIFFVCIIILTGGLYAYNSYIAEKNVTIETSIVTLDSQISEAKKNRGVLVSTLLFAHKGLLKEMEKRNEIAEFITHMDTMERKYNLKFDGFNYENGIITTSVAFESKKSDIADKVGVDKTYAYKDSVTFIKKYRENTEVDFELEFINSVSGTDNISFPISLRLK